MARLHEPWMPERYRRVTHAVPVDTSWLGQALLIHLICSTAFAVDDSTFPRKDIVGGSPASVYDYPKLRSHGGVRSRCRIATCLHRISD